MQDSSDRAIDLQAGPLTMVFEPSNAFLRYIRLGDREVVRGVYAAVRDQNWHTISPDVTNLDVERRGRGFTLRFDARARERDVDFSWRGRIEGSPDGTVRFEFDGEALSTFSRNRIGFCVLHPVHECAGRTCVVTRDDGSTIEAQFPEDVSPHQPVKDVRKIAHEVREGVRAEVSFEGDVFEMEDQRNWSDASYKTYCTPLSRPLPVVVEAGTTIRQAVTLHLKGAVPTEPEPSDAESIFLTQGTSHGGRLPPIGLADAAHDSPLTDGEVRLLRALAPNHLRVDLDLSSPTLKDDLARALLRSEALDAPLELAALVGDDAEREFDRLTELLEDRHPLLARCLVLPRSNAAADERMLAAGKRAMASYDAGVSVFAGTNAYFVEVNRNRLPKGSADGICFSVTPQVHAFDDASMVETVQSYEAMIRTARHFSDGAAVAVTPVTLKPRFNPDAADADERGDGGTDATAADESGDGGTHDADPRQATTFGAVWTLGSIKHLVECGTDSITFFETTGRAGVIEREAASRDGDGFPSEPGHAFPLYHVLADVLELSDGIIVPTDSTDRLAVESLVIARSSNLHILLANYSDDVQRVRMSYTDTPSTVKIRRLSKEGVADAGRDPSAFRRRNEACDPSGIVVLKPHEYVRLDAEGAAGGWG